MSRIPIRIRLTLAFALAMAVVLAAIGGFLYVRLGSSLDEAIDESLQARLVEVCARAARERRRPSPPPASPRSASSRSSTPTAMSSAATRGVDGTLLDAGRARTRAGHAYLARRFRTSPGTTVASGFSPPPSTRRAGRGSCSSASSLEDRDDAVRELLTLLFVAAPVALLLASLLGYALATLALRPVESMRREAAAISATEPAGGFRCPQRATRSPAWARR